MANIIELKNKKTGVKQYPITKAQAVYGLDGNTVSQKLVTDEADIASLKEQVSGFTRLSEGSTTGDAELINTRTTWYGTTEASAGNAVRNQAENLILTQSGKPTGNALKGNKVWIKPSQDDIEIPDMDDFNKITEETENLFWFTDISNRTSNGLSLEFLDNSTIKINGTANQNVTLFTRGDTKSSDQGLPAGTYTCKIELLSGEASVALTSLRYGTSLTSWKSGNTITLNNDSTVCLRLSANNTYTNAIYRIIVKIGTSANNYIEGGLSSIDIIARSQVKELQNISDELIKSFTGNDWNYWEQGSFLPSTGALITGNNVRSTKFLPEGLNKIETKNNFVFYLLAYDRKNNYIGAWDNNKKQFANSYSEWYNYILFNEIPSFDNYRYKIVGKNIDTTITNLNQFKTSITILINTIPGIEKNIEILEDQIESNILTFSGDQISKWTLGSIRAKDGSNSSSIFVYRSDYLPKGILDISIISNDYVLYLFAYQSDGTYIGAYNNITNQFTTSLSTWYNSINFNNFPSTYKYRITIKKDSSSTPFEISDAYDDISANVNSIQYLIGEAEKEQENNNDNIASQIDNIVALKSTSIWQNNNNYIPPLVLLHFSDPHSCDEAYEYIANFTSKRTDINDIICTGDIVGSYYTEASVQKWNYYFDSPYALLTLGNHEYYLDSSYSENMTMEQAYNLYLAPSIEEWGVVYTQGRTYWYKDYLEQKVRLIALDNMLEASDMAVQVSWLEDVLTNALSNELSVVVASHCPPRRTGVKIESSFTANKPIPDHNEGIAIDQNGVSLLAAIDTFMNNGGDFVCHLMGHWHEDYLMKSSLYPNQTIIVIGTASYLDGPNINKEYGVRRDFGTKYQNLFNLVAIDTVSGLFKICRIGADRDMFMRSRTTLCYDYRNHNLIYSD